ncbi:hypothetical protein P7D31_05155 [Enterococcus dongliensis]|uniref:hypothetical protein n=1 Tax=Enterococcus dongliensis TaxID=2559925 RepID=UPI00288EB186|nr:hypothetical protein [Enterococcus dongliensis]MDT2639510.1 hypothetical protein [Enterococcus dongliensis]
MFQELILLEILMIIYGIGLVIGTIRIFVKEKILDALTLFCGIALIIAGVFAILLTQLLDL